ncbi:MAG: RNA polymerase sigma factor [Pseudomonadota bacterium]
MTAATDDDWDLASRADPEAMDQLFRRHRDFVFRVLLSQTGSPASAEDLTQEVFLRVATRRKPFFKGARFTTFLFRIAANLARDQQRRLRREVALEEHHQEPAPHVPETAAGEDAALLRTLATALARLPERQRDVIIFRELEGLSNDETARALGISGGSVKTHRSRALKQLRKHFVFP